MRTSVQRSALAQLCNYQSMVDETWARGDKPTAAEITQLRMLYVEFGMTPQSRSKVSSVGGSEEKNPFAEFAG